GLFFRRTISIDDTNMFQVTDAVENNTGGPVPFYPYARLRREGTPHVQGIYILHECLSGVPGQARLHDITYPNALQANGGATVTDAKGGWLGITDKYWAATLIPNQSVSYTASMTGQAGTAGQPDSYQADYLLPAVTLPAG